MKKILLVMGVGILVLSGGCSGKPEDVTNQFSDSIVSEDKVSENLISGNETSDSEVSANGILENVISENGISEDETPETVYHIEDDDIINLEEALDTYWTFLTETQRGITIEESYVDDVPIELQNLLIYCNDGIDDERDEYWAEYGVDCEYITEENKDHYPIEDIVLDAYDYTYLKVLDIDGDGEDEYFHYHGNGTSGWTYLCFHKNIEGVWEEIAVNNTEGSNIILRYEDRYYLLSDECITWWNDEVKIPWRSAAIIGGDPCWNSLSIEKIPTEYTPYEIYSNVQDESIDYLENINLDCKDFSNDIEKVEINSFGWHTDEVSLSTKYGWERSYDGEQYLYVITERWTSRRIYLESWDNQLIIMHQTEDGAWEIVKVYYLMTNYDCSLTLGLAVDAK